MVWYRFKQALVASLVFAFSTGAAAAQEAENEASDAGRRRAARPEFSPPDAKPGLPNVLSIGDSISIGYLLPLRKELKGEANVYRPPTNCGPTSRGLEQLEDWLGDRQWDVIHFNFGLHDLKYLGPEGQNLADPDDSRSHPQVPIDQYEKNLRTIVQRLKQTGATVIWRETTPVPEGARGRVPGDSARYNAVAAEVMDEVGGVATDPMFEYASKQPIASEQRAANVHYTDRGSELLAEQAAKSIRAAIEDN